MPPKYVIFNCECDQVWIVAKWAPDSQLYRSIAECTSEGVARVVLKAFQERE